MLLYGRHPFLSESDSLLNSAEQVRFVWPWLLDQHLRTSHQAVAYPTAATHPIALQK